MFFGFHGLSPQTPPSRPYLFIHILEAYARFKPETFFASLIIIRAEQELTPKAASKYILWRLLQVEPAKDH